MDQETVPKLPDKYQLENNPRSKNLETQKYKEEQKHEIDQWSVTRQTEATRLLCYCVQFLTRISIQNIANGVVTYETQHSWVVSEKKSTIFMFI